MTLREDEIHIKNLIESHLKRTHTQVSVIKGEDPPDCYVILSGKKIPLELTRAESEHSTATESVLSFFESLNTEYESEKYGYSIFIHVYGPVLKYGDFKAVVRDGIRSFIADADDYEYDELNRLEFDDETVTISKIKKDQSGFIVGGYGEKSNPASSLIQNRTDIVYLNILKSKEKKIKAIGGEKWLAIYNLMILSSIQNIENAINKYQNEHSFTKVFVIHANEEISEL